MSNICFYFLYVKTASLELEFKLFQLSILLTVITFKLIKLNMWSPLEHTVKTEFTSFQSIL